MEGGQLSDYLVVGVNEREQGAVCIGIEERNFWKV